ncbi:hypothetical protein BU14_0673s0011 [Porphyra umbilicalis]|uniref:Uncharacterized protein n=1 Tax=Porphyra umbilicalis TaxID=2786 RepID=A0A1X6NQ41_PORUM|nr:hypothetical protein BU14_0673s0011 [Porphyra umbilicalis]|eukprot:OSX70759.1 hypothetical protein BU14_0673s0011 [Porphyra umbilicalis]
MGAGLRMVGPEGHRLAPARDLQAGIYTIQGATYVHARCLAAATAATAALQQNLLVARYEPVVWHRLQLERPVAIVIGCGGEHDLVVTRVHHALVGVPLVHGD